MKTLFIFGLKLLSLLPVMGCIAWLIKRLWVLQAPRSLEIYLSLLGASYLLAYFIFPKVAQTEHSYAVYYGLYLIPLLFSALSVAARWATDLGWDNGLLGILCAAGIASYFGWLFAKEIAEPTLATDELLGMGWFFCVVGLLCLASAIPSCSALQFRLRIAFGIFWLLSGAYYFCDALGTFRARALWDSISGYTSQVLCIVCLGGLAWILSRGQWELSYEPVRELVREAVQP